MKNIGFLFILTLLFLTSCKDRPNIIIEGKLQNGAGEMIYLDFLQINKTVGVDSVKVRKDESFKFRFFSEYPGVYLLRIENGSIINLLPFPGENLFVEADINKFSSNYTVAGSSESEHLRQLVEKLNDTRSKIDALNASYGGLTNLRDEQASEYIRQLKEINKDQRDFSIQFIIEHLSSISSIYALYQEISDGQYVLGGNFDIQYMKIVADSVSKYYPEVPFVKSFVADARRAEEKVNNLNALKQKMKEAKATDLDISLPDKNENLVSLFSFKGKPVLLYFWSTKSADSRALNPLLKKTYDKYKSKGFEIYAVAVEDSKADWLKAIRFDELDWINVYELTYPDSRAANLYNVKVLPSSFLYNSSGDIVARNVFGQELEKWLDNIL